jgi:hypothetical protein
MDKIITKLGGRKFFLVLLVFLSSSFLLATKKIADVAFMNLSQMLLVAYVLGNVSQTFILNKLETSTTLESDPINDPFGGRKFILVFLMYSNMFAFVWYNHITANMYVEFTQWLVTVYIAGNLTSKAVENGLNITIGKK